MLLPGGSARVRRVQRESTKSTSGERIINGMKKTKTLQRYVIATTHSTSILFRDFFICMCPFFYFWQITYFWYSSSTS